MMLTQSKKLVLSQETLWRLTEGLRTSALLTSEPDCTGKTCDKECSADSMCESFCICVSDTIPC